MSLKKLKEDLEKQIEVAVEREEKEDATALEEFNKLVDSEKEETKPEEKTNEDEGKEDSQKDDTKRQEGDGSDVAKDAAKEEMKAEEKTPAEYAKERKAKKIEKDRMADDLAAANARIAALEASAKPVKQQETAKDPEPNRSSNPAEWNDWRTRQLEKQVQGLAGWKAEQETVKARTDLTTRAQKEIEAFSAEVRKTNPDLDDARDYYGRIVMASTKITNPKMSHQELIDTTNQWLLNRASQLFNEGYENPVEAMYLEAKSLGYKPKEADKVNVKEEKEVEADPKKVATYRARNAGTVGSGGGGEDDTVTPKVASGMTNAEFAKLKPAQKKKMFEALQRGVA